MWIDAKTAAARLAANDDIVLLCHRDPDGDTYGSATALAEVLTAMGKRVRIECPTAFPANLSFLDREYPDFAEGYVVAVDIASVTMLGDGPIRERKVHLCIDHHPTNIGYADETYLAPYAAAGEAMLEVIRAMQMPVTPTVATALYTALSSDTGGFRFANTTTQTLRYAADLMDLGADVELVRRRLFESNSRGRVLVESEAMANARFYHNNEIAVLSISLEMVERHNVDESELEGIASEPLKIAGVRIGITLKERADGSVRVSVRSDSDEADVSAVCRQFVGGGHVRAAGCRLWDTLENAEARLVAACEEELDKV